MIFLFLLSALLSAQTCQDTNVLILRVIDHPALNETSQGALNTLLDGGIDKSRCKEVSAQGQPDIAQKSIAKEMSASQKLIVIGVGTMPSLATKSAIKKASSQGRLRLIYASVTDPVKAKLIDDAQTSSETCSGVSNFTAIEPQIAFFRRLQPNIKKLGVLYNPGEENSVNMCSEIEKALETYNASSGQETISLERKAVPSVEAISEATRSLSQEVDAIFVSNDNLCLSCIPLISKIASQNNVPLFVSDTDVVDKGAIAALGPNQYDIGVKAGEMALQSMQNESNIIMVSVSVSVKMVVLFNKERLGADCKMCNPMEYPM